MKYTAFFASLLVCLGSVAPAQAEDWGPWDRPASTALPEAAAHEGEAPGTSANLPLQWLLRAYQLTLSRQDQVECQMFPSCSRFAMQAYAAYDPLQATLMTADRLIRDNPGATALLHEVMVGEHRRLADPPSEHVLW